METIASGNHMEFPLARQDIDEFFSIGFSPFRFAYREEMEYICIKYK